MNINEGFIAENVKKHTGSDYWHMVELYYAQLNGILEGFLQKSHEENLPYGDFDVKHGIRLINYLVDFFDYSAKYKAEVGGKKQKQTKPSCSVLIKYLAEERDLFVGHNTWHLYSAMGYRSDWSTLIGPDPSRYCPLIGPDHSRYCPLIGPDHSRYCPLIGGTNVYVLCHNNTPHGKYLCLSLY